MALRNLFFGILLCFISLTVIADDAGFEIPPKQYAEEESAASVQNYANILCHTAGYQCLGLRKHAHWYKLFPNYQLRQEMMRLNRTNVSLMYRDWIVVPKNLSKVNYMDLSPLPQTMDTHGKKLLFVNLGLFAFGAYDEHGHLIYWGPASGGAEKCAATDKNCSTVTGHFRIFRTGDENCTSNEYPLETHGGAPMPYCMFFHRGTAIHASTLSGFINRSSGCIRLFYADAQWLYEQFVKVGTRIVVEK